MRSFPTRLAAIAFSLLSLSACDSGEVEGESTPDALVGSWSLQETTSETFLTVSQAQTVVDQSATPTGSVAVSGAQTTTLRFIAYVSSEPFYPEALLTSYDPNTPPTTAVRYELRLDGYGTARLVVRQSSGQYDEYISYGSGTPAFTYVDGRLTVRPATLQPYFGGTGSVAIGAGSLTFPTVQLPANQPTRVRSTTTPFEGDPYNDEIRYVFEEGGVYRSERDYFPNRTRSVEGTWAADGDRLRLSVADEGVTETETFRYTVDASRLRLSVSADNCRADAFCLESAERGFGLQTGTLTQYTTDTGTAFAPTAESGTRVARPAGTQPAEARPAEARREMTVWPRALARPVDAR